MCGSQIAHRNDKWWGSWLRWDESESGQTQVDWQEVAVAFWDTRRGFHQSLTQISASYESVSANVLLHNSLYRGNGSRGLPMIRSSIPHTETFPKLLFPVKKKTCINSVLIKFSFQICPPSVLTICLSEFLWNINNKFFKIFTIIF